MVSCLASAMYMHDVDILQQTRTVNEETGETIRAWTFLKTVRAYVYPYIAGGMRGMGSNEDYDDRYLNSDFLRIKTHKKLDKRWRVTNIRLHKTKRLVFEEYSTGVPTEYNVDGSAPIANPIGSSITEWVSTLSRGEIQK